MGSKTITKGHWSAAPEPSGTTPLAFSSWTYPRNWPQFHLWLISVGVGMPYFCRVGT